MQTQGNVSACLSLQGNPSPNRTAVGDSVLRACGSVLSENPCNSHLTLEDAEACRGSLPAVSQLPGGQTLQGSAPQRGLLLTAGRVPAGRRVSGRAGEDTVWRCTGLTLGSRLGWPSRHLGHDPEGKQSHMRGSKGIQPSGALLRVAPLPPERRLGVSSLLEWALPPALPLGSECSLEVRCGGSPAGMAERRLHGALYPSSSAPKGVQKAPKIPLPTVSLSVRLGLGAFLPGVGACGGGQGRWEEVAGPQQCQGACSRHGMGATDEDGHCGGQTAPGSLAYPAGKERAGKGLLRWWGSTSKVATVTTRSD